MYELYNVDESLLASALTPPNKRMDVFNAWMKEQMSAIQRNNNLLNYYIAQTGTDAYGSASAYSSGTTYSLGDIVRGTYSTGQSIFESQTDGNIGNSLTDTINWIQINPTFIGSVERINYNCGRVIFEWALNKFFHSTFKQPGYTVGSPGIIWDTRKSDIYITTNSATVPLMYITSDDGTTYTTFSKSSSTGWISPDDTPSFFSASQYVIHVKSTVYSTITGGDNTIRQFADKYSPIGLKYSIVTY